MNSFFFFEYDSQNRTHFFECDSNWNFWLKISQKNSKLIFSHDPKNRTRFFFNMTQRIEPFSIGLKDLMLFSLTQRIELFLTRTDRIGPFSWIWLRELKFFLGFLHVYFFQKWCRELNLFFFEYDAKNWTLFFLWMWRQELELFSWIWRKELNPFLIWSKETNFYFSDMNDSKNCFFKQKILNELNFLKYDSKNWTFEPCVKKKLREWNSFKMIFWNDS